jgi:hypothetical protein
MHCNIFWLALSQLVRVKHKCTWISIGLAAHCAGQTSRVQGRVLFPGDTAGSGLEISLSLDGQRPAIAPALSDAQGRFQFDGVPTGRYRLMVFRWGVVKQTWDRDVEVGPEYSDAEIVFRIEPYGIIFGSVRDGNGDPVPDVALYALRRAWAFGRPYLKNEWQGGTDDQGGYRLWNLPPGLYRICGVSPPPFRRLPAAGSVSFAKDVGTLAGIADCPSSGPFIDLPPGGSLRADLRIRAVATVPVDVKMPSGGFPLVELIPRFGPNETQNLFAAPALVVDRWSNGMGRAEAVPPRDYWLRSASQSRNSSGEKAITVTSKGPNVFDLTVGPVPVVKLEVRLPPGRSGSFKIGFRNASDPGAPVIDPSTQLTYGAPTDPSTIRLPYPGRYWLVVRSDFCTASARVGPMDLLRAPLAIAVGETVTLRVTFNTDCAKLTGKVPGAMPARVALLLSGTPEEPGDVLFGSTNVSGEYAFYGLLPGTYMAWAWTEEDERRGRIGSLAEMRAQAQTVKLAAGHTAYIDLPAGRPGK